MELRRVEGEPPLQGGAGEGVEIARAGAIIIEAEVRLIACQMTVDLFDMDSSSFIEGIEFAGAARFFEFAGESDICLYI